MNSEEDIDTMLKGLTLKVYKYVLKNGKPTSIREVQRSLELSTPTLALYHLGKLERAGLLRKEPKGYVINRVYLKNFVKIRRLLIPRYFFYFIFLATALTFELSIFRPRVLSRDYVFSVAVICTAAAFCIYETVRAFAKKGI